MLRTILLLSFLLLASCSKKQSSATASSAEQCLASFPKNETLISSQAPSMSDHHMGAYTKLSDGKILCSGSISSHPEFISDNRYLNSELYDPTTNSFSSVGQMQILRRTSFTQTLLNDGKVLIVGGNQLFQWTTNQGYKYYQQLNSGEIFDPSAAQYTLTGSLNSARVHHRAVLLNDGSVLITGGMFDTDPFSSIQEKYISYDTAEIYNPTTSQFTLLANKMTTKRSNHIMIKLNNGKVLLAGGFRYHEEKFLVRADGVNVSYTFEAIKTAEIFDTNTNTFSSVGNMKYPRADAKALLLSSGKVLIVGGGAHDASNPNDLILPGETLAQSAEIFDPTTNTFSQVEDMKIPRAGFDLSLLPDGKALVSGGGNCAGALPYLEIFDPSTNKFTLIGRMAKGRTEVHAMPLDNGKTILIGGCNSAGCMKTAEFY